MDGQSYDNDDDVHLRRSLADAEAEIKDLHVGLQNRTVIGQAQGILMERLSIDEDHAMDYLRRVSSHSNTKLVEVARRLVKTRQLPPTP